MNGIVQFFTPERRQSIQLFAGSLAPLAILVGFGTQGIWDQSLILIGAALQFLSSLLSLVNVRRGDWGTGWAIVRGAVYTLAMVVSPALVFFGVYDESTNATVLVGVSLGLSALSSLLAVFIGKQATIEALQQEVVVVREQAATATAITREQYRHDNGIAGP